jgi:hypothetical protein
MEERQSRSWTTLRSAPAARGVGSAVAQVVQPDGWESSVCDEFPELGADGGGVQRAAVGIGGHEAALNPCFARRPVFCRARWARSTSMVSEASDLGFAELDGPADLGDMRGVGDGG